MLEPTLKEVSACFYTGSPSVFIAKGNISNSSSIHTSLRNFLNSSTIFEDYENDGNVVSLADSASQILLQILQRSFHLFERLLDQVEQVVITHNCEYDDTVGIRAQICTKTPLGPQGPHSHQS